MKKREPWGLIIYDYDRNLYALTGEISNDDEWNEKICEERAKGRDISCETYFIENGESIHRQAEERGLVIMGVRDILPGLPSPYM